MNKNTRELKIIITTLGKSFRGGNAIQNGVPIKLDNSGFRIAPKDRRETA